MKYIIFLICIFLPLLVLRQSRIRRMKCLVLHKKKQKTNTGKGEKKYMLKLLQTFIGKDCEIRSVDNTYEGEFMAIESGWIVLIDRWYGTQVLINPEYVIGIRELKLKKKKRGPETGVEFVAATKGYEPPKAMAVNKEEEAEEKAAEKSEEKTEEKPEEKTEE